MADHGHDTAHTSRTAYLAIFGVLAVLTVLEVLVANPSLGIPRGSVGVALVVLALTKAALVAFYFMHLKHEMKSLKLTVLVPFLFPALYAFVLISEAAWRLAAW